MKASIITIGDEILIGQIVDTNSAYIAQKISNLGFTVDEKISIGDRAEAITSTLDRALTTSDVIIITGGLGPTKDDITKHTLAKYFDSKLVPNQQVAEHVRRLMEQRGVEYNALNQGQSLVPECCTILFNDHGTAPGMWFEVGSKVVISLPGVPFEMEQLMLNSVLPRLRNHFTLLESVHRTMITSGLAESMLAAKIEAWEDVLPSYIKLAYLPSPNRVRLRLSAYEIEQADIERVRAEISNAFENLEELIPNYILGYESITIEQIVHDKLIAAGKTLAVAESCTGGRISSKFTAMAGASTYFNCAITSYSNRSKVDCLGVNPETLESYGAVSEQVAIEMARGVMAAGNSDFAVSTTGIAGPTGGSEQKPVGTVWIGVASKNRAFAILKQCGTERSQIIERAASEAITLLNTIL